MSVLALVVDGQKSQQIRLSSNRLDKVGL